MTPKWVQATWGMYMREEAWDKSTWSGEHQRTSETANVPSFLYTISCTHAGFYFLPPFCLALTGYLLFLSSVVSSSKLLQVPLPPSCFQELLEPSVNAYTCEKCQHLICGPPFGTPASPLPWNATRVLVYNGNRGWRAKDLGSLQTTQGKSIMIEREDFWLKLLK